MFVALSKFATNSSWAALESDVARLPRERTSLFELVLGKLKASAHIQATLLSAPCQFLKKMKVVSLWKTQRGSDVVSFSAPRRSFFPNLEN